MSLPGGINYPTAKKALETGQVCGAPTAHPPISPGMEDQHKIPSWLTPNALRGIFHSALGIAELHLPHARAQLILTLDKNHLCSCFGNSISRARRVLLDFYLQPTLGSCRNLVPINGNKLMRCSLQLWVCSSQGQEGFSPKESIKPCQIIPVNLRSHRRNLGAGDGGGKVCCGVEKTWRKSQANPEKIPVKSIFSKIKAGSTQGWKQLQHPHGWRIQGQSC